VKEHKRGKVDQRSIAGTSKPFFCWHPISEKRRIKVHAKSTEWQGRVEYREKLKVEVGEDREGSFVTCHEFLKEEFTLFVEEYKRVLLFALCYSHVALTLLTLVSLVASSVRQLFCIVVCVYTRTYTRQ